MTHRLSNKKIRSFSYYLGPCAFWAYRISTVGIFNDPFCFCSLNSQSSSHVPTDNRKLEPKFCKYEMKSLTMLNGLEMSSVYNNNLSAQSKIDR